MGVEQVLWPQSLFSIKVTVRSSDPSRSVGTFSAVTWRRWLATSPASCSVRVLNVSTVKRSEASSCRFVNSSCCLSQTGWQLSSMQRFVNNDVLKILFAYCMSVLLGSEHDVAVEWRLSSGRTQVSECNYPERNFLRDFLSYFRESQDRSLSHRCHWSSVPSIDVSWLQFE